MWSTPSDVIEGDPGVMKDFISILGCEGFCLTCWLSLSFDIFLIDCKS